MMLDEDGWQINDMKRSSSSGVLQVNTAPDFLRVCVERLPGNPSFFASSLQKSTCCGNLLRLKDARSCVSEKASAAARSGAPAIGADWD